MNMKKVTVLFSCMAMAAGLLAGCGENSSNSSTGSSGSADSDAVTITVAQDLDTNEKANNVMNEVIQKFTDDTGIQVKFESLPSSDYRTWLTTQFAADKGPDVYSGIIYDVTQDYQSGWLCNFKDLYEKESEYDPGQAWKDTLPDYISERMYITEEDVPGYPTATSVVRIFVNKDLLESVGAEVPETWAEFMDICQKLKDGGIIPFAFPNATIDDLSWLWFSNSVCSQLDSGIVDELDVSGNGYVELAEMCKGMDEGKIDFSDTSLQASFELMKEFSQYWTSDYNGLDQKTAIEMFERGDVAMVQAMSTNLEGIADVVGDSFEYVVIPVPTITTETNGNALGKSVILGGQPDIIYCMNKALEEDQEKYDAALKFVQYISSPEVQTKFAEEICRIPLSLSCELPERLEGFKITEEPLRMAWFTGVNEEWRNYFQRAGQEYLSDAIDLKEFTDTINSSLKQVLEGVKAENGWSTDNNYGL